MNEIERILGLIVEGKITRAEAAKLLSTISPELARFPESTWERLFATLDGGMTVSALARVLAAREGMAVHHMAPRPPMPPKTARLMRVAVESSDGLRARVNLPFGLANFALKFVPEEAREALEDHGIDVSHLAELLKSDLPDGEVVSVEDGEGFAVRIWVE